GAERVPVPPAPGPDVLRREDDRRSALVPEDDPRRGVVVRTGMADILEPPLVFTLQAGDDLGVLARDIVLLAGVRLQVKELEFRRAGERLLAGIRGVEQLPAFRNGREIVVLRRHIA